MRHKSFAVMAMLAIAAALMSSVIPGSINVVFAEKDNYSQDSDSEEDRHSEDESNHDEDEEDRDSAGSNNDEDDEEDSEDNARSEDAEEDNDEEDNGDNGDTSETETEQENRQKNVCSGWAVCINVAENAKDATTVTTGTDVASTASDIPFQLATPF